MCNYYNSKYHECYKVGGGTMCGGDPEKCHLVERSDDDVSHPSHYTAGAVECIDAMVSAFGAREVSNYCICNAFKYIFRHERKNGEEDIAKAEWYLAKYRELRYGTLENH